MCQMSCVLCHVSCAICHVSRVPCHMSHVTFIIFFADNVVKVVGGGSVINGATSSSFDASKVEAT